ncbi:MAG: hypothetical protein E6I56_09270 [Chloroflexi bacterium]|nr:MAG: hypothetical protein E6I56_09270 [Chloroflexota bacterium]
MDLDDVTAELLELPLDQFTARRNARAKELKAAGKAELASEVAALKKPPVHLWAANRAARGNQALLRKLHNAAQNVINEPAAGDDVLTMFQAGAPPRRESSPTPKSAGEDPHAARAAERTARLDAERAEQLETSARRLRAEADEAAAQARRAEERAKAAEKEAAQARAQAKKSARAVGARGD